MSPKVIGFAARVKQPTLGVKNAGAREASLETVCNPGAK
jgi:hypothetical protein